jgi:NAD(P)-dependent dehydrogenase (short-subunit alcohol dehydrogenase family)
MSNSAQISGKVSVVTGGTRGIGRGIAAKLVELGARVIITGRNAQSATQAASEISAEGKKCEGLECNVSDPAAVVALADDVRSRYGRIDILVNNAGIGGPASLLHELEPAAFDRIFNTNVRGVFYMLREFVPLMISSGGGDIINISSLAGKNPLPKGAAYSASKWALNGLSYSVAEELRQHNIRVSVICPGSVDTEFSPHTGKSSDKMLRPEDIAHVAGMLVTQRSQSFVSEVLLRPTQKP